MATMLRIIRPFSASGRIRADGESSSACEGHLSVFFGFQKAIQFFRFGRVGIDSGIAKESGEHANDIGARLHLGPIHPAAFGESRQTSRKF